MTPDPAPQSLCQTPVIITRTPPCPPRTQLATDVSVHVLKHASDSFPRVCLQAAVNQTPPIGVMLSWLRAGWLPRYRWRPCLFPPCFHVKMKWNHGAVCPPALSTAVFFSFFSSWASVMSALVTPPDGGGSPRRRFLHRCSNDTWNRR